MTIKVTELLKLLTKVEKLGLSVNVREDKAGDYVIRIYEMFRQEGFDEKVVISQNGESNWNKGSYGFDAMMDWFDVMLEEKRQEEIKAQKRQELIARLTDEEKELLGLGVSSQSVPHKSQMPF
jgi:cytochrome P450